MRCFFSIFTFLLLFTFSFSKAGYATEAQPPLPCTIEWLEKNKKEGIERRAKHKGDSTFHLEEFRYYQHYSHCSDDFYRLEELRQMAENLISFQHPEHGGWDKHSQHDGFTKNTRSEYGVGTVDNGQTTGQIWFLARVHFSADEGSKIKTQTAEAIIKGITKYLFKTQYSIGGIPQTYPDPVGYRRFIKINQNSMAQALEIFRQVHRENKYFSFLSGKIKEEAKKRYELGVDFLIRSQIIQNKTRTGWAQQYFGYRAVGARSFELPGIASRESVGVINFLLEDYHKNKEIRLAVDAAIQWLEKSEIKNIVLYRIRDSKEIACEEKEGARLWTRFYDLKTNQSFFAGRSKNWENPNRYTAKTGNPWIEDGLCQTWEKFRDKEPERADGYSWYFSNAGSTIDRYYEIKESND